MTIYHFSASMNLPANAVFKTLFDSLTEPRVIVNADSPNFTVVANNAAHQAATYMAGKNIIGQSRFIH